MEDKKEILFYGYDDDKATHIYNLINLFIPTLFTVIIAIIFTTISLLINKYSILFIWILPSILMLSIFINLFLINYNDSNSLKVKK